MDRRAHDYMPRSGSRERRFERRFEERPPASRPSRERSPYRHDSPPRRRQFRERDGNDSPVGSRERRGAGTRRFTERPRSRSPSFERDSFRRKSPLRDSPLFSKRRQFKESPDRSPVNPYSNVDKSGGRRRFSPDTFGMKPGSVDDNVDRSAGRSRLSPNTLMRIEQVQKGKGSAFPSELDKLKGYESPEYSDDGDDYGDRRDLNSIRNESFYEKQKFETIPKTDNLQNIQPQSEDRYFNPVGNTVQPQIVDPYTQMGFRNVEPQSGAVYAVAYQFGAGISPSPVGNLNVVPTNLNFNDQRSGMLSSNQGRPGLDSPQLNQNPQYTRQDVPVHRNEDNMYYGKNDISNFVPPSGEDRVPYNANDNTRDLDFYKGDNRIETRKRQMDRSDLRDDDVKFRRSDHPDSDRFYQPVGIQTKQNVGVDRNRSQIETYPGQFNPSMAPSSTDPFSHSRIDQLQAAANLNPDRKRELDLLLSQSEMLNKRISNIISTEKNQGDLPLPGAGLNKVPPFSGTQKQQSDRYGDESQYDWGYNPPWRQNEPLPRKPIIPEREQEFKQASQAGILKQPIGDNYEEDDDDDYMSEPRNAPRFQGQHNAPRGQGQPNAPRGQGQPNAPRGRGQPSNVPGFQPSTQSRNQGQRFGPGQSRVSEYENEYLQPKQAYNPIQRNMSEKDDFPDRDIPPFQQQGFQRKGSEYEAPRQANIQRQNNLNMQNQGPYSSRPPQTAVPKPAENDSPLARYPYGSGQKQSTLGDERPVGSRYTNTAAQKPFGEGYEPQRARYPQGATQKPFDREREPPRYPQTMTDRESGGPRYPQTMVNRDSERTGFSQPTTHRPSAREKEPPRYPQTSAQKFVREKDPPRYPQKTDERPASASRERESPKYPPKNLQKPAGENNFSNSNPYVYKASNLNTGRNLQQKTSSLDKKSQAPKNLETEETENFDVEEFDNWTGDADMETDLDSEEKSKTVGPIQKDTRYADEVEFQALGEWLGVSKIKWNIKPTTAQTKVVVRKKGGPVLFEACGTQCTVQNLYKNRIKFHGDTTLGTLYFDLEDCCFADEGLYVGSYDNRIFSGPNLKLWTHAIEGETALVLFKMPKMPPNEKVTVYKKNGDTLLIAWGTMAQFTDKYKGKAEYFGDTEKGLIVFSIKNVIQTQSGVYMASVGNNSYEGRQLKVDLPAQKKKRKNKFATTAVKEKAITSMINLLKQKSKGEQVQASTLNRLASYHSVPLFFEYRSIPGPAGSKYITGTMCAFEDLYLARMTGKSKDEIRPKMMQRALSNLLSKTYSQLVQNSLKELELPIGLLSNQISKGILQLGGEIAKVPPVKKENVKTNVVGQKKPAIPVFKKESSSPTKPTATTTPSKPTTTATPSKPAATTTSSKPAATATSSKPAATATPSKPAATATPSKPAATATPSKPAAATADTVKTTKVSTSGDIKIDLLHANDAKAKEILTSMATSSEISHSDFQDSIGSMKNRKGVELAFLLKTVGIREKFKMESGLGDSSEKIRTTSNVYSNLKFYSYSERQQACNKPLDELIIFHGYPKEELAPNAYQILSESTKLCVMHLQWHSKQLIPASRECYQSQCVGKLIGDAITVGGKVGRQLATAQALVYLIKRQPVIQYVELEKQSSFCVTLEEAQRRAEGLKEQEDQKDQTDDNPNKWLSRVCEDIILQYSTEPTVENLEFQPGFPKKVLLDIKKLCDKHQLTFKAYLKDKEYINVVGKNLNPGEILSLLQQNGGTSGRYRLVPKLECEAVAEELMASLTDDLYLNPNAYDK